MQAHKRLPLQTITMQLLKTQMSEGINTGIFMNAFFTAQLPIFNYISTGILQKYFFNH